MSATKEPADREGGAWEIGVFALAIVGSAFLIFFVQPMVAKRILPWFGGTPAVWMICLAFYQSALFLGYAYAHALIRFASPRAQAVIHTGVLLAAIASLPILPDPSWASSSVEEPTRRIVALLVAEIAIPFMALAATGPLVQAWFARRHPSRSPYPLYALSNIGSMAALFAFPFLVEPNLALSVAGRGWGAAVVVVAAGIFACGVIAARSRTASAADASSTSNAGSVEASAREPVGAWLLLSAAAVVLLMGVTNRLCQDVASVPFLWVLPLSIYLTTFIVCFADERFYKRGIFLGLALVVLAVDGGAGPAIKIIGYEKPEFLFRLQFQIAILALLLFSICMLLHGELYRLRPPPERLTAFYLYVSGGGALGGLFVGLAAPQVFSDYYEFEVALALALVGVAAALLDRLRSSTSESATIVEKIGPRGIAVLATGLVTLHIGLSIHEPDILIWRERSFFGVLQVNEDGAARARNRTLKHGSTLHGIQWMASGGAYLPTSYYGRATGLGVWMQGRPANRSMRIGAVGLGVGTIAAYGRVGDVIRFYELDPAVAFAAGSDGYFEFLSDSRATVEVELGDARLLLERERAEGRQQEFDLLVVDAFSSDSIPTHLMTREAFEVYRSALADGGVIAVHVSNRYLNLVPIVSRIAQSVGLHSYALRTVLARRLHSSPAKWVFLSESASALDAIRARVPVVHARLGLTGRSFLEIEFDAETLEATPLWSDDYTGLLGALKPFQ